MITSGRIKSPVKEDNGKMVTWYKMDDNDILAKLVESGDLPCGYFRVAYYLRRLKPYIKKNYLIGLSTEEVKRLIAAY